MASSAHPVVLTKITHYRDGEVIVVTPQEGEQVPLRDPEIVKQFLVLLKKLKNSEEISEPYPIGDASYTLAPSLTVDSIGGPVFWEEIEQLLKAGRA